MTVGGLMDALALFSRDTEVVIYDADTSWWLAVQEVRSERHEGREIVVVAGDYHNEGNYQ